MKIKWKNLKIIKMVCKYCKNSKKDWEGSDRVCAFDEDGNFERENWNCDLINSIRDRLESSDCHYNKNDETTLVTIPYEKGYLLMGWYKSRGSVDFLTLVNEDFYEVNLNPSIEEIEEVYNYIR